MGEPKTITLFMGAHGSEPIMHPGRPNTRKLNPHTYRNGFTVNFLSFAGLANITTDVGLVYERKSAQLAHILRTINRKYRSTLFTRKVAEKFNGFGTDRVALAYLVPNIFNYRKINSQAVAIQVMEIMKNEMLAAGMLADLEFSDTSPPEIRPNPQFEKRWWFDNNPGDELRRFNTSDRSGQARHAGNIEDNPILATNGLFILQTTDDVHRRFSISDITGSEKFTTIDKKPFIQSANAITSINLLLKTSYTSYWKKWIEDFDFSSVPDNDVPEIGNVAEAALILKQMYYAFNSETTVYDPADEEEINRMVDEANEGILQPRSTPDPPQLSAEIKTVLKHIFAESGESGEKIVNLVKDVNAANEKVKSERAIFQQEAAAADNLEEMIKELNDESGVVTRSKTSLMSDMTDKLTAADTELDIRRDQLTKLKETAASRESELDVLKGSIIARVTEFIKYILSSHRPEVKAAIKNIIMRNKLKNILKMGILHKRLSLSRVIIFFRSFGYNIVNIVDPSCFVLKNDDPKYADAEIDTQGIPGEFDYIGDAKTPIGDNERLISSLKELGQPVKTSRNFALGRPSGGTKRKKTKCSRKRRTRRKRCTTQRRRRRQKRQNF